LRDAGRRADRAAVLLRAARDPRTVVRALIAPHAAAGEGRGCDGAFINHPDADLADPVLNASGVPWHTLYYKTNYPRLQRIKAQWDPRNVFRHALSIRMGS